MRARAKSTVAYAALVLAVVSVPTLAQAQALEAYAGTQASVDVTDLPPATEPSPEDTALIGQALAVDPSSLAGTPSRTLALPAIKHEKTFDVSRTNAQPDGSGTVAEMSEWVEYLTRDGDSPMVALRKANGREAPWRIPFWGIGNEPWGCGGNFTAQAYADEARRYATYCRDHGDNRLYKIAAGANSDDYAWTETLLKSGTPPPCPAAPAMIFAIRHAPVWKTASLNNTPGVIGAPG